MPKRPQESTQPTRREFLERGLASASLPLVADQAPKPDSTALGEGGRITDVRGLKVGHYTDGRRPTGCTVVICEEGAVAGVDVRGAAPGTRETDLLDPVNLVQRVHAVVLSGGSAFGLDTATGVMRYLEDRGIGFPTGVAKVPIVPAAILFDLGVGDPKIRPDAEAGYKACRSATVEAPAEGNVGAGAGATVGKLFGMARAMKSGIGTASIRLKGGRPDQSDLVVGAIVAVNAIGDVIDPATGKILAGARTADGKSRLGSMGAILGGEPLPPILAGTATTIGIVATDVRLDKAQATKVAQMAHDGLARTINPVHTAYDGDTVFALSTGKSSRPANVTLIGALAAEAMAVAVVRAVRAARGIEGLPSAAELVP
ncbi:MAG TPA: P1 family peptidase [Blastocatellia bacterium]|nr:P1 family peptidase [Blastocatellia bacterium]